ncbi:MAG: glutaredoxin family protein [Candidatus Acidiferrales bacterium]
MKKSQSASEPTAKQQCTLASLYFQLFIPAVLYVGGLAYLVYRRNWLELFLWLVLLPCVRWLGLRISPLTSEWRGYGSVADKLASSVSKAHVEVTAYFHNGCPFCPILKRRLEALQKEMGFTLKEIDLTLQPRIAANRGIKSVPVVEVGDNRLVGNATTEQLAELIAGAKVSDAPLGA